jgi:hypothetical protein
MVQTRNFLDLSAMRAHVSRRYHEHPQFSITRPDAGLRTRWIAVIVSNPRRENASASIARAAAVAYPLPQYGRPIQ